MSRIREFYGDGMVMLDLPDDADAGSSNAMEFSSDEGGSRFTGYDVAKLAAASGLSEGAMAWKLRDAGVKVGMADGNRVLAEKEGTDRAMRHGTVPTPTKGDRIIRQGGDDHASVDERTAGAAAALGIDMETGKPAAEESKPTPTSSAPADPFAKPADPAVEHRTSAVAEAMGLELGSKPEPTQKSDATTRTISKTHKRRRLGQPRRWSER